MLPVQIRDDPERVRTPQLPNSDMTRDHAGGWLRVSDDVLDEETQFPDRGVGEDHRQDMVHISGSLRLEVPSCCIECWA